MNLSPITPDLVSPTFLISSNAAQEFIALQSAEITRLRADVDQLKAQNANLAVHDPDRGSNGGHVSDNKSVVSDIKEHLSSVLQDLVADLKTELLNQAAGREDAPEPSEEEPVIKEIREEVIQCRSEVSKLTDCLETVAGLMQEFVEKATDVCRTAIEEVAQSGRKINVQELTSELMSTRRALEKFRVPELVLTARWADERASAAHPAGERSISPTPSIVELGEDDNHTGSHVDEDEAELVSILYTPENICDNLHQQPSERTASPVDPPTHATVETQSSASAHSTATSFIEHPSTPDPLSPGSHDARSLKYGDELPSPPPSSKAVSGISGGPSNSSSTPWSLAGSSRVVSAKRKVEDLFQPLPNFNDSDIQSLREELSRACGISGISFMNHGSFVWRDCPQKAWLLRPSSILTPKSVKKRMKSMVRNPERWTEEYVVEFAGCWYYLGTYSALDEPTLVTTAEFRGLSREDKESFAIQYMRLHRDPRDVPSFIRDIEYGTTTIAKYQVSRVDFKKHVEEYLRHR